MGKRNWSVLMMVLVTLTAQAQEADRKVSSTAPGVQVTLGLADVLVAGAAGTATLRRAQAGPILKNLGRTSSLMLTTTREGYFRRAGEVRASAALASGSVESARGNLRFYRAHDDVFATNYWSSVVEERARYTEGLHQEASELAGRAMSAPTDAEIGARISDEAKALRGIGRTAKNNLASRKGAATAAVAVFTTYEALARALKGTDAGWSPGVSLVKNKFDQGVAAARRDARWLYEQFTVTQDGK